MLVNNLVTGVRFKMKFPKALFQALYFSLLTNVLLFNLD